MTTSWNGLCRVNKATATSAAKTTIPAAAPTSINRIRRRSSGTDRRYRRYSMITPRTVQKANV